MMKERVNNSTKVTIFITAAVMLLSFSCIGGKERSFDSKTGYPALPEGLCFVPIPGDTHILGDIEKGGVGIPNAVHEAAIQPFEMGTHEITNAQYAMFLNMAFRSGDITVSGNDIFGKNWLYEGKRFSDAFTSRWLTDPERLFDIGSGNGENQSWIRFYRGTFKTTIGKELRPVISVTWYGAKAFAKYYGLDLPTEDEWEYACRGGKQYLYGTDDGTINPSKANYWESHIFHPVDVGSYSPNPFGLYDMSGNVEEWCDGVCFDGIRRIFRGGSFETGINSCRASYRLIQRADFASRG